MPDASSGVIAEPSMRAVARQRGWAFLIVLIALAIAAFLARDSLTQFFGAARDARVVRPATVEPAATQATPEARTPVERARSVESTVQQGADQVRKRIDEQAR